MGRMTISALALLLTNVGLASSGPAVPPTIKVAFYAPRAFYLPDQEDPPVHIINFENNRREIRWVVSNTSDKAVASVIILNVTVSPPGCTSRPERNSSSSGSRYPVAIAPHGTAVVSRDDHYPKMMVSRAKYLGAPYVQVQFAISGVYFEDGTTWPVPIDPRLYTQPFDRELVKSASEGCSGGAKAAAALDLVDSNQIIFDQQSFQTSDFDADHSAIPQLHFSCALEGPKAICHMPPETSASH